MSVTVGWAQSVRPVDRVVAVVNDGIVTERELAARVGVVRVTDPRAAASLSEQSLREQVLEQMVLEQALVQRARERGITIDEGQIDRGLEAIASNNRVTVDTLRRRLEAEGASIDAFREQIRAQIAEVRLRELEVESTLRVSDADVEAFLADPANQERSVPEYRIAQIFLSLPETPDPELLAQRTERMRAVRERVRQGESFETLAREISEGAEAEQGGSFGWRSADQLPGLFVSAIEPLSVGDTSDIVRSPAGLHLLKLQERRGGGSGAGGEPLQQTRVRHILIRTGVGGRSEAEARQLLDRVRSRLVDGSARFETMARQYSEDGSASRGGELGWVAPGNTVPEFERAMGELDPGEVSPVVQSPFGLHLIQVIERRTSGSTADRAKERARQMLLRRRSAEAWSDWLAQLRDQTYVEMRLEP